LNNYFKSADSNWFRQRLTGVLLFIVAAFAVLLVRLFYLQVIRGDEYRRLSESNCIRLQYISPQRGLIFDRNGELLVDNRPSFDLSIILKDARPLTQTLEKLSGYINVPVEQFAETITRNKSVPSYKPILLQADVGRDIMAAVQVHQYDLPGVEITVTPCRHYIYEQSAAHLIGYLGEINGEELRSGKFPETRGGDYIGRYGVEKSYESYLHGTGGGRQVEVNVRGQVVNVLKTVDAGQGHEVYLTIDSALQRKAETLLAGRAGAVVAMDPDTGEILAMASSPSFDQNEFVGGISKDQWRSLLSNPDKPLQNKTIQAVYPPASTYKIITAIAGLEEGIIDEHTEFTCYGSYKFGDRRFRCWRKQGHGALAVEEALSQSCDVFFYQLGQRLGVDKLAEYANRCGLGVKTGLHLENEESGLIPTSKWKKRKTGISWQAGETLSVAIGQGYNLVTPMQMAVFMAAVANGGNRPEPILVRRICSVNGDVLLENKPRIVDRLPFSKTTLDLVKKGLWQVVNGKTGTAKIAHLKDIEISGKTGTAQVFSHKSKDDRDDDLSDHLKPHAWFVAYAPSDHPRIAVSVIIEHGEHGSSAAGPVARDLIQFYMGEQSADSGQAS